MSGKMTLSVALVLIVGAVLAWRVMALEPGEPADEHDHESHGSEHDDHGGEGHDDHDGGSEHATHADKDTGESDQAKIPDDALADAGIVLASAGPAEIRETLVLKGRVVADGDRLAHVYPRFPGVVKTVHRRLGDRVGSGSPLAVIQSNESLAVYEIAAPQAGTVIEKHATAGEFANDSDRLFTIADLRRIWLELAVYRPDFASVRKGQSVAVDAGGHSFEAAISYLSPTVDERTQTLTARCVLSNPEGALRPGMFVEATVTLAEHPVPLAVKTDAIHSFEGREVVFVRSDAHFEPRPVKTGASSEDWTQIEDGLEAGELYAGEGAYVVKAEILKASAGHEH